MGNNDTVRMSVLACLLVAASLGAQPMTFDGRLCRMNRAGERMIVAADAGPRLRVVANDAAVTFEGIAYDRLDLRLGDRVRVAGNRNGSQIRATLIDARVRPADALADSLFPTRTLVGRFSVREAQTEFFMLNLPGGNSIRVDATAAYGPNGRVRASSLKSGDLLEVRGEWPEKGLLKASSINVITDKEDDTCRAVARRGESKADTSARESDEAKFLRGRD